MPTSCARLTVMVLTRMGQRVGQGQGAIVLAAEIGGLVAVDVHRLVIARVPGRDAGFQRRQIDEGLEGRAGLAMRLDGAVEHRILIIDAADHGADTAPSGFIITTAASLTRSLLAVFVDGADARPGARLPALWAPAWCAPPGRRWAPRHSRVASLRGLVGGGVEEDSCAHPVLARSITTAGWARASSACASVMAPVIHHGIQHQAGALLGARADRAAARTPKARGSGSPASPPGPGSDCAR